MPTINNSHMEQSTILSDHTTEAKKPNTQKPKANPARRQGRSIS